MFDTSELLNSEVMLRISWSRTVAQRAQAASSEDPKLRITHHGVEIVRLLSTGKRGRQIAKHLGVAVGTVYEEIESLRLRLGARTNPELVRLAIHHGFISASTNPP